jgi:hypothetical protein
MIQSYKQLIVWQKSKQLVIEVYKLTENFPKFDYLQVDSLLEETMKMLNAMLRKMNPHALDTNEAKEAKS